MLGFKIFYSDGSSDLPHLLVPICNLQLQGLLTGQRYPFVLSKSTFTAINFGVCILY